MACLQAHKSALEKQISTMIALGFHEKVLRPYGQQGMTPEAYTARLQHYEIHPPTRPETFVRPLLIDPAVTPSTQKASLCLNATSYEKSEQNIDTCFIHVSKDSLWRDRFALANPYVLFVNLGNPDQSSTPFARLTRGLQSLFQNGKAKPGSLSMLARALQRHNQRGLTLLEGMALLREEPMLLEQGLYALGSIYHPPATLFADYGYPAFLLHHGAKEIVCTSQHETVQAKWHLPTTEKLPLPHQEKKRLW